MSSCEPEALPPPIPLRNCASSFCCSQSSCCSARSFRPPGAMSGCKYPAWWTRNCAQLAHVDELRQSRLLPRLTRFLANETHKGDSVQSKCALRKHVAHMLRICNSFQYIKLNAHARLCAVCSIGQYTTCPSLLGNVPLYMASVFQEWNICATC